MSSVQTMKTVSTFTATIYVGFREQYTGIVRDITMAKEFLQAKADVGGLYVTVTPLCFIYKDGSEPGCAIGLINYPRFPEEPDQLKAKALELAQGLLTIYKQRKVSIVFRDETVMLEAS